MVEVKNTVKRLEGRVQRLQQQLNGLCPETTLETQLRVFPLTSEKDVAALEPKLGCPEFRKEMVSYLERLGGETFKDAVVIMTKRLLSNEVMLLYTLKARAPKSALNFWLSMDACEMYCLNACLPLTAHGSHNVLENFCQEHPTEKAAGRNDER
ncbi:unnamed protein product [Ixodes pacificus]